MAETASLTEEEAAALGLSADNEFKCADCEFQGASKASLAQHRRQQHRTPKAAPRTAAPAPSDLVADLVIGKAVANLQVIGGYVSIVLPHTGLAIAGIPGEKENDPPVVQSRAVVAGRVLAKWAQRDERVLRALDRFNQLFESSEIVELAVGMGAAVATDLGAVDPNLTLEIGPFTGENAIRPVHAVIGDVVQYVELVRAEQASSNGRPPPDGIAPDGAEIVRGGMEDT